MRWIFAKLQDSSWKPNLIVFIFTFSYLHHHIINMNVNQSHRLMNRIGIDFQLGPASLPQNTTLEGLLHLDKLWPKYSQWSLLSLSLLHCHVIRAIKLCLANRYHKILWWKIVKSMFLIKEEKNIELYSRVVLSNIAHFGFNWRRTRKMYTYLQHWYKV